jgi:hypothetical protein
MKLEVDKETEESEICTIRNNAETSGVQGLNSACYQF